MWSKDGGKGDFNQMLDELGDKYLSFFMLLNDLPVLLECCETE